MNPQIHTNYNNYTQLAMPRQLVLPLDFGIMIKETAPINNYDKSRLLKSAFFVCLPPIT